MFIIKHLGKGGIYLIQYKKDSNIYYIVRINNFKNRLNAHLRSKRTNKFHLFINLLASENFHFSIVQICDINIKREKEICIKKKNICLY